MTETRRGLIAGLAAYLIWGVLPLYLRLLRGIPAEDVLAHRICWSVLVVGMAVLATGGLPRLRAALGQPRLILMLLASAVAIAVNWLAYTLAVMSGHALDTSLGYFINPLVSVMFGVVLLGERLSRPAWTAVGLAALGVAVLAIAHGSLPLTSLTVAISFAIYGLIRKQAAVDAMTGLFVETVLLAPMAIAWLGTRSASPLDLPAATLALLAAGGVLTAAPLMLFGFASRRLPLATIGLLQYLTPSMVFLQAVFLFGEPIDAAQMFAFACIWGGLAVYTLSLRRPVAPAPQPR